jgi:hypothetical protein
MPSTLSVQSTASTADLNTVLSSSRTSQLAIAHSQREARLLLSSVRANRQSISATMRPRNLADEEAQQQRHIDLINQSRNCMRTVPRSFRRLFTEMSSAILMRYAIASSQRNEQQQLTHLVQFLSLPRQHLSTDGQSRAGHSARKRNERERLQQMIEFQSQLQHHHDSGSTDVLQYSHSSATAIESASELQDVEDRELMQRRGIKSAMSLVRDGHTLRAARRLMRTSTPVSNMNESQLNVMQQLHPQRDGSMPFMPQLPESSHAIHVQDGELQRVIAKLNTGSAPGLSGWSFDMLQMISRDNTCLSGIKHIVQDILSGTMPIAAREFLLSSQLIGIPKSNSDKLRPIAIGESIYRVAASYALLGASEATESLRPLQFGVSTRGGADQMLHQTQHELSTPDASAICIDFANAFNSIDRHKVLTSLYSKREYSSLWRIAAFTYSEPTKLYTRSSTTDNLESSIISSQGVRQGDPLASLLFSLAIDSTLRSIQQTHKVTVRAYLDDVVITGKPAVCFAAYKQLVNSAQHHLQLKVQPTKCAFINFHRTTATIQNLINEAAMQQHSVCAPLLGSFIGINDKAVSESLRASSNLSHTQFFDAIKNEQMSTQCAMSFLRLSAMPKMSYLLRVNTPNRIQSAAAEFDKQLSAATAHTLRLKSRLDYLATEDKAAHSRVLQQLALPISRCGFGLRRASELSPICYLTSITSCIEHCIEYWKEVFKNKQNSAALTQSIDDASSRIKLRINNASECSKLLPPDASRIIQWVAKQSTHDASSKNRQHNITLACESKEFDSFLHAADESACMQLRSHLKSLAQPFTHDWLKALPVTNHLTITDEAFQHASLHRLWLPQSDWQPRSDNKCSLCSIDITHDYYHSNSCTKVTASKHQRHNGIRDMFVDYCNRLSLSCTKEPHYTCSDGKRPDLSLMFDRRLPVMADVTVIDPLSHTRSNSNMCPKRACEIAATHKKSKYKELVDSSHVEFIPLVFTTYNQRGCDTQKLFSDLITQGRELHCVYDARDTLFELTHGIAVHLVHANHLAYSEWINRISRTDDTSRPTGPCAAAELRRAHANILQQAGMG